MSQEVENTPHTSELAQSLAVPTSESARQKQRIASLEEKLQSLESGREAKQREINYYVSKGRAIRHIVSLFDSIKDLIVENDRRCDSNELDENLTIDQERLQVGYITLNQALLWFHSRASEVEYDEYSEMLKKLRQGADAAQGDDTSKLKSLVAGWLNREFKPTPPIDPDDKNCRGFINDACGRLLCPTELDWNNPRVKAGIRDRADGYVVTKMSWPAFLYEKYTADQDNLEEGLFKSSLLIQAFKAIFMSPSSAKEVTGDGDGANVTENCRCAKNLDRKVKTHISLNWPPGRLAQQKVDRLLAWWTRKIFGTSRHAELTEGAKAKMSVNALARQRAQMDDALFDSE
ncbi:uncharacterized protein EDB93DRAFT_1109221 [Suillus bovinus]|uniref:uncharacterized protein n=1 Tax=Suillus bovinus TaxID=48563 RepID=UPI001B872CF7|nr:uncharacterized protein EDB93DRAFT_1109221 [Suillus bovinus]KAG2127596.1 hypothetical protein EDB93DRAFT_1109221 [Suillus bovinus]